MMSVSRDMFPNKSSFGIFILYILLFVNQGVLVTSSQESDNSYSYSTQVAVLLTELLKLLVSIGAYSLQEPLSSLLTQTRSHLNVVCFYLVPATLYSIYNSLSYLNLSVFDPTTYFLALQLRVVLTGLLFQVIFKRKLSRRQWSALVLLTGGCCLKELCLGEEACSASTSGGEDQLTPEKQLSLGLDSSSLLLLAQVCCSCLAGVYNEYLLKSHSGQISLHLQNTYQYLDSVLVQLIILTLQGDLTSLVQPETYTPFFTVRVILVVCNNAAIGIVTSFFLRYLNSILKTFASGLELVVTSVVCYLLFSIPIYLNTVLSIVVVISATVLYSQSPLPLPTATSSGGATSSGSATSSILSSSKEKLLDKYEVL